MSDQDDLVVSPIAWSLPHGPLEGCTLSGRELADAQSEMRSLRGLIDELIFEVGCANREGGDSESASGSAKTEITRGE